MMNKSASSLLSLWSKAIPLKKARFHFAPAPLMARLAENPAKSGIETIAEFTRIFTLPVAERDEAMLRCHNAAGRHDAVMKDIHRAFWHLLRNSRLRCLAFEAPRKTADQPIEVPSSLIEAYPDWETGIYKHAGLHLIEMRVIEAEQRRLAAAPEIPAPSGRPSFKAEILEAFEVLQAEGRFKAKPFTHGIAQIRAWIKENRPHSIAAQSILSDETIRITIKSGPQAGDERSSKKQ